MRSLDFWDCEICERAAIYWTVVPIQWSFIEISDFYLFNGYCEIHAKGRDVLTRDEMDVLAIMTS